MYGEERVEATNLAGCLQRWEDEDEKRWEGQGGMTMAQAGHQAARKLVLQVDQLGSDSLERAGGGSKHTKC